jgi:hypothetical protein
MPCSATFQGKKNARNAFLIETQNRQNETELFIGKKVTVFLAQKWSSKSPFCLANKKKQHRSLKYCQGAKAHHQRKKMQRISQIHSKEYSDLRRRLKQANQNPAKLFIWAYFFRTEKYHEEFRILLQTYGIGIRSSKQEDRVGAVHGDRLIHFIDRCFLNLIKIMFTMKRKEGSYWGKHLACSSAKSC